MQALALTTVIHFFFSQFALIPYKIKLLKHCCDRKMLLLILSTFSLDIVEYLSEVDEDLAFPCADKFII